MNMDEPQLGLVGVKYAFSVCGVTEAQEAALLAQGFPYMESFVNLRPKDVENMIKTPPEIMRVVQAMASHLGQVLIAS